MFVCVCVCVCVCMSRSVMDKLKIRRPVVVQSADGLHTSRGCFKGEYACGYFHISSGCFKGVFCVRMSMVQTMASTSYYYIKVVNVRACM